MIGKYIFKSAEECIAMCIPCKKKIFYFNLGKYNINLTKNRI